MREPARLIELVKRRVVRLPGRDSLPLGDRRLQGGHVKVNTIPGSCLSLPLLRLSAFGHARFVHGWQLQCRWLHGFDLIYLSELYPTWQND